MRDYAELVKALRFAFAQPCYSCVLGEKCNWGDFCFFKRSADAIEELLADVPKNGMWIAERDGSIVEFSKDGFVGDSCHCSVCNEHLDGSEEYAVKGIFCPSCGAIMNR